jgi:hypothetical protein
MAAMSSDGPTDVVLYARSSCHLCDDARDVILAERGRTAFEFREILIDGDESLERAFGLRVPVVLVGGQETFEFTVDPAELARLVRR